MLLAGVVMKLGAYGCLRVAITLFPHGLDPWAVQPYSPSVLASLLSHSLIANVQWALHLVGFGSWRDVFSLLAVVGIVYGGTVALVQRDFKFVIGYSSVSHMGFVLLGLLTLNTVGLSGAVLQMFSHGIIAGLLFAVVGRMVYDRTHTRELADLQRMNLSKLIPFAAVTFILASMASMGLPGFSGFVAELQVLIGAWQASPTLAVLAGGGILIGVAYALRALQLAFFGDQAPPAPAAGAEGYVPAALEPISVPERIGAAVIIGISLLIGLYPSLLLDLISQSFGSQLFDWLPKGGTP
jgi:NADH-quinone oxidoreductase subunit M